MRAIRIAVRQLRKTPGLTAIVLLTLGLCIGANTAVYSVLDAVLLRPAPYPDISRLALVTTAVHGSSAEFIQNRLTGALFQAVRDGAPGLDCAAMNGGTGGANFASGGHAEFVQQQRVSAGFFRVLGVLPQYGREFTRVEDVPNGPPAAILSDEFWHRQFHADPGVLGRAILLRGEPFTVVGIMPRGFRSSAPVDVWTPLQPTRTGEGGGSNYLVIARLRPGVSWAEASGQLQALSRSLMDIPEFTNFYKSFEERLMPYQAAMTSDVRSELWLTWGAVLVVLVIGCVNIAGLLLARSGARSREIATRMALGGTRWKVVRQLLIESLLLALGGCIVGFAVGAYSLEWLKELGAKNFALWHPIELDGRVMAAMLGVGVLTSLLFGLFPALQTSRLDIRSVLVEGGRGIAGTRNQWARQALIAGEVALSLVLLVSAGLLVRTLDYLHGLNPGFDPKNVLTAQVSLQDARYTTSESVDRLFRTSLDRLRRARGVEAAGVALSVPYEAPLNIGFRVLGSSMHGRLPIEMAYVTPGYFDTLRIPLLRGRGIEARDAAEAAPVALVSAAFARRYLGGVDSAIGHQIDIVGPPRSIVGVVGDVQQSSNLDRSMGPLGANPMVYIPAAQTTGSFLSLVHRWFSPKWVVRMSGGANPGRMQSLMQSAVAAADPQLPVSHVQSIEDIEAHSTGDERYLAALFTIFAVLAVVLAALGLYGLISNTIAQRMHELGVRIALGATAQQTIAAVVRPAVTLATVGIAVGCGLSLAAGRLLEHHLFGVRAGDPATFAATALLLLAIAAAASLAPAVRLLRLDPARTLRSE